ncbi:MAG: hypothetical protein ACYC7A_18955 [Thermoanaerobaculia bacterium]
MRLVEIKDSYGEVFYLNPAAVVALRMASKSSSEIVLAGGGVIAVKTSVIALARLLGFQIQN